MAKTRRKKTAVKKTGVKKTAVKKTGVKKTGVKKTGVKKTGAAGKRSSRGKKGAKPAKQAKSPLRKAAEEVAGQLAGAGYEAVFAGGCVRDMLMDLEPKDYDIATDATPRVVQDMFPKTYAVGAQFGVVVVRRGKYQFEVATFREDSIYSDGRHPDAVSFGDARADVQRRDFTINGMLYDPRTNKVIDHVGGQKDLKARIVRCIGEPAERFSEDSLRMLRAVRFATRLGFEIEPATRAAIREHAARIIAVSQERIKAEIEQILTCDAAAKGVMELRELGLLRHILPEVESMAEVPLATGTLLDHAVAVLEKVTQPAFDIALAALLHCSGGADEKEQTGESARLASVASRRLRCSNAERSCAVWLVQNQHELEDPKTRRPSHLKRLYAHENFDKLLAFFEAKAQAGCASKRDCAHVRQQFGRLSRDDIRPEPFLTGTDLIEMGLTPSELFSVILDRVYTTQLDGEISGRQSAIDLALKIARES